MCQKLLCGVCAASILAFASAAAIAQTPPPGATATSTTNDGLLEIVVTAERRTTNLQTAAVAATVLSGADLANKGVTSVDDLQMVAPSVTIQNYGQGNDFNIRGIGRGVENLATPPGVVIYRDGVATFPGYFQNEPYFDIASLEVLRGPQGTFAGQNATGGAIFITEANPNFEGLHGYVQAQYGNYNDGQVQGAVNIPISDTLAARIAFNEEYHDSFYRVTGPYTGNPGLTRTTSERLSLLWNPTEQLKVLFKVDHSYISLGGTPSSPYYSTSDPFDMTANAHFLAIDNFGRSVLDAKYTFADDITLRSVSGYQRGRTATAGDSDGTDILSDTFKDNIYETIFSQELTLISPDSGPLTWVAGLYYSHDTLTLPTGGYDYGLPGGVYDITVVGTSPRENEAVFGQISFDMQAGFQLQAGARYSSYHVTNDIQEAIPEYGVVLPDNQSEHDSKVTGKVALNWTVDRDNFLYAFVATGHKGGGLNVPTNAMLPPLFKPEDVTDYEIGWKATRFDGHLKTQLGAYYDDYKGFQVSLPNPTTPTQSLEVNVPNLSTLYGFEAQAQAQFGALSFDLTGSLARSEMGTFYAVDPRNPGPGACAATYGPASLVCLNLSGNQQVYAPTVTYNVGAQYVLQLAGGDTLSPRANFGHIGPQWATIFENASLGDRLGDRNLLAAQLPYRHGDWLISGYGTNLTNQHYVSALDGGQRYPGVPRQYGLRLTKNF